MKNLRTFILLALLFTTLTNGEVSLAGIGTEHLQESKKPLKLEPLHVPGRVYEEEVFEEDEESLMLDKALRDNQRSLKSWEDKGKKYSKLRGVVEKMQEKHFNYVESKFGYEEMVAMMNKQLECAQNKENKEKEGCEELFGKNRGKISLNPVALPSDSLSQQTFKLFKENEAGFAFCYQYNLNYQGKLIMEFRIDQNGKAYDPQLITEGNSALSQGLAQCFLTSLQRMVFPEEMRDPRLLVRQPLSLSLKGEKIQPIF